MWTRRLRLLSVSGLPSVSGTVGRAAISLTEPRSPPPGRTRARLSRRRFPCARRRERARWLYARRTKTRARGRRVPRSAQARRRQRRREAASPRPGGTPRRPPCSVAVDSAPGGRERGSESPSRALDGSAASDRTPALRRRRPRSRHRLASALGAVEHGFHRGRVPPRAAVSGRHVVGVQPLRDLR